MLRRNLHFFYDVFVQEVLRVKEDFRITNKEIGKKLGTDAANISSLLHNRRLMTIDRVGEIADALDCDIDFRLIPRIKRKPAPRTYPTKKAKTPFPADQKRYPHAYWSSRDQKWCVEIRIEGKRKKVGMYKDSKEGALAYNEAAKKYFGEKAVLIEI